MPRLRIGAEAVGKRVDQLVAGAVPGLSAAAARRLIAAGAVRVGGRTARKGDRVTAGQTVDVDDAALAARANTAPAPDATIALEILHADDALIAIAKPAGIPSHPLRPGERGTAANAIVVKFPECASASDEPREAGLAHRLDTATSGVLVAARRPDVWRRLRAALTSAGAEKIYLAEVTGAPPARGESSAPIGRVGRRGTRVRVGAGRLPLPAHTDWDVVERRDSTALVEVRLHAGRAHQVRAHLAAAGFPIVGDDRYGGGAAERLHLHALSVRFHHPVTGEVISIAAPPPEWAKITPQ